MQRFERLYTFSFLPLIILILGICFSTIIAWKSALWLEKTERIRFNTASEQITFLIQKELEAEIQLLHSASALISSSYDITHKEWKMFAQIQNLKQNFPGLQALGFAPLVPASMRDMYEEKIRHEGIENYTIFPRNNISDMFPITYLEPFFEQNQRALGFDMASEPTRQKAIYEALKRGEATLSSKIELIQEKESFEKAGFVIYMPLYTMDMPLNTQEERLRAAKGVIYSAMKAKTLFQGILGAKYILIDFEIYDGNTPKAENILYDSNPKLTLPRMERYVVFEFYGKKWTLYFKTDEALDVGANRYMPHIQLIAGILFSIILSGWFYALQRTRKRAYEIAEEKTKQLSRSESEIRSIFQAMNEGILVLNAQGVIIECNLAAQEMLKCSASDMIGSSHRYYPWKLLNENGSVLEFYEQPSYKALFMKEPQYGVILALERTDGSRIWILTNVQPIYSDDFEEVISVIVTFSDITEYRQSKHQLEAYVSIIDIHVIISTTDLEGMITDVSEAFCKISGYTKEELLGKSHNIVRHPDVPSSLYEAMWAMLKEEKSWQGEIKNRRKDGSAYWVDTIIAPRYNEAGNIVGYTAIRQDITDKKRVEELSITDRLTGLFNRLKLDELFALHLNIARRYKREFSIVLLDIDKFKSVNDNYGHQVGDSVLQELAHILKENIRGEDAVGRWGGEEFLILLPSCNNDEALILAEKVRYLIECYSFLTVGQKTASFGVSTYHDGDDEKSMVARADEALYRAKENGRNRVEKEEYTCELPMH